MTAQTSASARQPRDPLLGEQVAVALRTGDTAEAERLLRGRLLKAPCDADAMMTLADLALDRGDAQEAMALLYRALAIVPEAHQLRLRLSILHQQRSQFPPALALLRQVPPDLRRTFERRAQEAALCGSVGLRDEEIAIYEQLARERPKHAPLWMSLGNALNYAGRREEAVTALRKATRLQPRFGEPWWSLANLKSFRFDDRDLAAMQKALRSNLSPLDALHFHFALGRVFEDRGDYRQSFDFYAAGNGLRAASLTPAQMRVTDFVDAAVATFTAELMGHYKRAGGDEPGPIFVIGLQRSGSTLIEQILASHPEIEGTAELMTMQHLWDDLAALAARQGRTIFQEIAHADPKVYRQIGEQYLERTKSFRVAGKRLFVDKLPANWLNIGLIRLALPNAKIIDARRHPMACGFSNFKQHYASGVTFAYSLPSIGYFYRDYLRMMQHFDGVQPGAVHRVLNERLIEDPKGEVSRMLDYIGVGFDPACLEFHTNKRSVHTPSAEQVRRPINREGMDQWRNYEAWLGPLQEALGPALAEWDR